MHRTEGRRLELTASKDADTSVLQAQGLALHQPPKKLEAHSPQSFQS